MSAEQAKQFLDQASESLRNSQFDQALELVNQALELNEKDSEAWVLKGIALASLDQPQASEEAFRKAILHSPYNAKAYYNLGVLKYGQGDKHEAYSMAQEALKIDMRHAGARELVARIDRERQPEVGIGTGTPTPSVSGDPLAPPPGVGGPVAPPPSSGGPMAPPSGVGPSAPPSGMGVPQEPAPVPPGGVIEPPRNVPPAGMGAAPPGMTPPPAGYGPQGGYTRPGYQQPAHSLAWVGNMGAAWTAIGWVLAAVSLIVFFVSFSMFAPYIQQVFANPGGPPPQPPQNLAISILGYSVLGLTLAYTICDLLDRRGNFLWLLLLVPCACCGANFISLPIYMLVGRK